MALQRYQSLQINDYIHRDYQRIICLFKLACALNTRAVTILTA